MFKIYYNNEYSCHKTLNSSFENQDRIDFVLKNIPKENLHFVSLNKFNIDVSFLNEISTCYNKINFWNCEECSFKNDGDIRNCVICNSLNKNNIKLISNIDGDTTSYSTLSFYSLLSNLNTIYTSLKDQIKNKNDAFLLIRPPGHHSNNCCDTLEKGFNKLHNYFGFCLINNVGMSVNYLQKYFNVNKIAIVDWDVHHGNGTQEIFYSRSDVLFIDIHRYDGVFFPKSGKLDETGETEGTEYTINIPLEKGSDEEVYLQKFIEIILPSLKKFEPEWILVSCGFDAHQKDPIGGMNLNSKSYKKFYSLLKEFNKPITMFLEGGYNKEVILESIQEMII